MRVILLLLATSFLLPREIFAQRVSLDASYNGGALTMSLSPSGTSGECTYLLYTATSKSRLQGSFARATLLAQLSGGSSTYIVTASNVPTYLRTRRQRSRTRTLRFRAIAVCGGRVLLSNSDSLKIPRISGSGVTSDAAWLASAQTSFQAASLALRRVFPNLSFNEPIDLQSVGDNRLFVAEKAGRILEFLNDNTTPQAGVFLDIRSEVNPEGEKGLLGFVFHPNYASNGFVFVHYSRVPGGDTTISRFAVSADPNQLDPASEQIILQFPVSQFSNHKGGQIAFGPDGFLYIALGDGGGAGDPLGSGQNTNTLRGKILRIDVDHTSGGLQYAIPTDNPFAGQSGKREEIFAYGMRNPFRMSFDSMTGLLWVADVGQSAFEEIDVVENGKNYGWNTMEGAHCYSPSSGCDRTGLTLPFFEYAHSGSNSITGGYVYHGARNASLSGKYIYADFIDGRIFALDPATVGNSVLFDTTKNWSSFGIDSNQELFILSYDEGAVYTLSPS